ncbi:MAG: hypothetical protein HS111_30420 [Kofleriaceae bacterium]|nr:hypothetical protein [Kofleriaceae bacterium]
MTGRRPPPSPPPDRLDPRLTAVFTAIGREAVAAAARARDLERQARVGAASITLRSIDLPPATAPRPDDADDDRVVVSADDLTGLLGGVVGGLPDDVGFGVRPPDADDDRDPDATPPPLAPRVLYRRGAGGFPPDLLERQGERVSAAVDACLASEAAVAAALAARRATITVRIYLDDDPPRIRVTGAGDLERCIERRVRPLPAAGLFLTAIRIAG